MTSFVGAETSLRGGDYIDVRSQTAEQPFHYLTRFVPVGECPSERPFTCTFNEGGARMTEPELRFGKGLSRVRGDLRPTSQIVGPAIYQHGNGDIQLVDDETTLRRGEKRRVLRGHRKPYASLQSYAQFQQAQTPWAKGIGTVERGRSKYEQAITCFSCMTYSPECYAPMNVEPFVPGGVSTRDAKDFQ